VALEQRDEPCVVAQVAPGVRGHQPRAQRTSEAADGEHPLTVGAGSGRTTATSAREATSVTTDGEIALPAPTLRAARRKVACCADSGLPSDVTWLGHCDP
jgi:hypothetical protein